MRSLLLVLTLLAISNSAQAQIFRRSYYRQPLPQKSHKTVDTRKVTEALEKSPAAKAPPKVELVAPEMPPTVVRAKPPQPKPADPPSDSKLIAP